MTNNNLKSSSEKISNFDITKFFDIDKNLTKSDILIIYDKVILELCLIKDKNIDKTYEVINNNIDFFIKFSNKFKYSNDIFKLNKIYNIKSYEEAITYFYDTRQNIEKYLDTNIEAKKKIKVSQEDVKDEVESILKISYSDVNNLITNIHYFNHKKDNISNLWEIAEKIYNLFSSIPLRESWNALINDRKNIIDNLIKNENELNYSSWFNSKTSIAFNSFFEKIFYYFINDILRDKYWDDVLIFKSSKLDDYFWSDYIIIKNNSNWFNIIWLDLTTSSSYEWFKKKWLYLDEKLWSFSDFNSIKDNHKKQIPDFIKSVKTWIKISKNLLDYKSVDEKLLFDNKIIAIEIEFAKYIVNYTVNYLADNLSEDFELIDYSDILKNSVSTYKIPIDYNNKNIYRSYFHNDIFLRKLINNLESSIWNIFDNTNIVDNSYNANLEKLFKKEQ